MQNYELMFVHKVVNEAEIKQFVDNVKEIIVEYGGIVKTVELWGKKRLIYGDAGISEGIYGLMKISIEREATPKVNQKLKGIEELLRYMLIRMEL